MLRLLQGDVGSGKSTLLELLCRVYDPNEGEILIDQNNIKNINLNKLYKYIFSSWRSF